MSSPEDRPSRQDRQAQSDQAWANFVRTPQGGCFTILLVLIVLASLVYSLFFS